MVLGLAILSLSITYKAHLYNLDLYGKENFDYIFSQSKISCNIYSFNLPWYTIVHSYALNWFMYNSASSNSSMASAILSRNHAEESFCEPMSSHWQPV